MTYSTEEKALRRPTSEEVRQLRVERECGMMEAYNVLWREELLRVVDIAETLDDLRPVIRDIVQRAYRV